MAAVVQELGQAAQAIGKVTETITNISAQTNLLALNATIEAARAGAAGKGFAVVAHEIKELAQQTAAATEDIKAKVSGVQMSTGNAIADIEKIAGVIKEVGTLVGSIATAIEEQTTVTKDVAANISQASTGIRDANERLAQTAQAARSIAQEIAQVSSQGRAANSDSLRLQEDAVMLQGVTERFDQLASRFTLGRATDFGAIKRAHLQLRSKLLEMFDGEQQVSLSELMDHRSCALGRWYETEAQDQLGHLDEFRELGEVHEAFHGLVAEIVALWNDGQAEEARRKFEGMVLHANRLIALLDELALAGAPVADHATAFHTEEPPARPATRSVVPSGRGGMSRIESHATTRD